MFLSGHIFLFLFGIYMVVELPGHIATLFNLLGNCQNASKVAILLYTLPGVFEHFNYLYEQIMQYFAFKFGKYIMHKK